MKKYRKHLAILLSLLLVLGLVIGNGISPVKAADDSDDDGYTYTVRIYAGAQGTFKDGSTVKVYTRKYGESISFTNDMIEVTKPSKYFVAGIKEAGKDNKEKPYFTVTKDIDYVVTYGVLGNAAEYTITYQDMDGKEIAPAQTGFANVGDTPIIGALIIPGYEDYTPGILTASGTFIEGHNLTRTLSANAAENIFPFVYRAPQAAPQESSSQQQQQQQQQQEQQTTPTTPTTEESSAAAGTEESSGAGTGEESSGAGTGESSQAGSQESSGGQQGETSQAGGQESSGGQQGETSQAGNQESSGSQANDSDIINLDDSSVPLAGPDDESSSDESSGGNKTKPSDLLKTPGGIIATVGVVTIIGLGLWGVIAATKKKKDDENK